MPLQVDATGQLVWVDETGEQVGQPVVSTQPQAPVPTSAQVPAQPPASPELYNQGGGGFSYSYSGTDPTLRQQAQEGYEGELARAQAQAKQEFEGAAQGYLGAATRRADALIAPEEMQGAPSRYAAETARTIAEAGANEELGRLQRQFADEEAQAHQATQAIEQQALNDYRGQVQQYQAMHVNPGQLWQDMGTGGRVGSVLAVAVHDFLGAKGIRTSAMDSLNKAIDRNIDAQVANIQKQGQVTEHFGQLYRFAVAQSASEAEVRTRMRGFYLAAAEKEILANLAQYDAPIAQAKAMEARALIADQFQRDITQLQQMTAQRLDAVRGDLLQKRGQDLSAAVQRAQLKWEKDKFGMEQAIAAQGAPVTDANVYVQPGAGGPDAPFVARGMIRTDITDAQKGDLLERTAAYRTMIRETKELNDLIAKHGAVYGGPWADKINDQEKREIQIKATRIAYNAAYARSGKQTAEKELEAFKEQYPIEKWTTRGGVDKILAGRVVEADKEFRDFASVLVREPQTAREAQAIQNYRPISNISVGGSLTTEASDIQTGANKVEPTKIDEYVQKIESPDPGTFTQFMKDDNFSNAVRNTWTSSGASDVAGSELPPRWAGEMLAMVNEVGKTSNKAEVLAAAAALKAYGNPKAKMYVDDTEQYLLADQNPEYKVKAAYSSFLANQLLAATGLEGSEIPEYVPPALSEPVSQPSQVSGNEPIRSMGVFTPGR